MNSIPASRFSKITPSVLPAGGNPLSLNSVFVTQDPTIPIGTVQGFPNAAAVRAWFGANSVEATLAGVYFGGFNGAGTLPSLLYFAQYNPADVAGYLRGGSLLGVALAVLQALNGTVIAPVDGRTVTSANINLAGATSPSNAAALIQAGLQTTGSIFAGTATLAGTVMTVASTVSGQLHIGDAVTGTGITGGTTVSSFGSYTTGSGVGTVNMSAAMTTEASPVAVDVTSAATVSYNAQLGEFVILSPTTGANSAVGFATGTISAALKLTSATGAVVSAGAVAAVPATFMDGVTNVTQNWVKFMTMFEPVLATKEAFATWVNTTDPPEAFEYVCWDSDITVTEGPAANSFGVITKDFNGVVAIYDATGVIAAFDCAITASTDFTAINGRVSYGFRSSPLVTPNITDQTSYDNLVANGYNCYANVATRAASFQFYQPGQISGDWNFEDSYVNQIYLNSQFQLANIELMANIKRFPYNATGYTLMRETAMDPINEGLNNGTVTPGVPLSAQQVQEVNALFGVNAAPQLSQLGWYLQILDAPPQVRAARGSPPCTFAYMDGESIQQIDMASVNVQ